MSAMLDTYDAPMSDYASDIDVFMQPHSDPWTQEDGTMDDDSFNTFNQTDPRKSSGMELVVSADPSHTSFDLSLEKDPLLARDAAAVEVDMEEYVEEAHEHEYEMVDDNEDRVHEIQDIEVSDAHLSGVDGDHSPQISYSLSNETSASIVEITSLVTPNPPEDVSHLDSLPTQDAPESHEIPSVTHDHDHSETPSAAIDTSVPTDSHPVSFQLDENTETATITDQEAVESSPEKPGSSSDNLDPTIEANEDRHLEDPSEPVTAEIATLVIPSELDPTQDAIPPPEVLQVGQLREDAAEEQPHGDHDETAESPSANPHEISEGVFIEPPPAIMIELPWGEDTYSIFNRPSPPSGRSTPSHHDSESNSNVIVLLHQQPTLFYESLHSVFEALRQEEAFNSLADLREAELIFSLPSLRLTVSEDNIYAGHVSLHDLSLLHDTVGGTGPLSMQLQIHTPRFTVRYDQLQEHLLQTVLDDDPHITQAPPEQDLSNSDDNAVNDTVEDTLNTESKPPSDDLPSHEFPQLELQDQHPPEDSHALDAVESANQDEVTTEDQSPELGVEPDTGELGRSDGDGPVFQEEAEEELVESAGRQAAEEEEVTHAEQGQAEEEEEVTHAEQDNEHENDDHHSASLADDPHPEAEEDQEYSQDGTEEEEGNYDEEEEEDDEESDATTEVPEVDEVELVEANDAFDQAPEEVDPTVDEASEQLEESTAQAIGLSRLTDDVNPPEIVEQESEIVEEVSLAYHDEDAEAKHANESEDVVNEAYSKPDDELEQVDEAHDFTNLPELPEDDEFWDEELDGEGEVDLDGSYYDDQQNGSPTNDDGSSVTLSSKGSKRAYSELDGEYDDEEFDLESVHSPEKRTRLE